jgi:hypothetical protein
MSWGLLARAFMMALSQIFFSRQAISLKASHQLARIPLLGLTVFARQTENRSC